MSLNNWNDSLDGLNLSGKVAEQSEQQREEAAAALAGIARTQKDEKKAQKYDVWLSELVKKLLQSSVYDHVITQLVPLLNARCPSHLLLGYLLPLSDEYMIIVREHLQLTQTSLPARINVSERKTYSEPLEPELARHLNVWMETLKGCISIDPSQTSTKKINDMMNTIHEEWLTRLSAHVIAHFLYDRGIDIQPSDAARVARGITKKMILLIQGITVDDFFAASVEIEPNKLF
jgi:hypothetical protein